MKRILVIDDDEDFLRVLKFGLTKEGFDVFQCNSGKAALSLLKSDNFAVIVSDYRLSDVSGLTIARAARKKSPPIPTILVTAYAGSLSSNLWENLPDRIYSKPIDFDTLIDAIEDLISKTPLNNTKE